MVFNLFPLITQNGHLKLFGFCFFFILQRLESTDFDEKKEINKRKQLILEGKVCHNLFLEHPWIPQVVETLANTQAPNFGVSDQCCANLPYQDPDLEAKRKAELEKIRSQKKKFKEKIQESLKKQKSGEVKKQLLKRKKAEAPP